MTLIRRVSVWTSPGLAVAAVVSALLALAPAGARAQTSAPPSPAAVRVLSDASGARLQVDGRDFMVFGMNWDYIPIGQNYLYDLWNQPDPMIEATLDREMSLLRNMGVNAIRLYPGIPPRWVRYIHERYGIYTVLNPALGRYGYTLDGVWYPTVNYSDPRFRAAITAEVTKLVDEFRNVPGVLMWLLGNENNYALTWTSFEIEALPQGERDTARARQLYSFFGEVIRAVKEHDPGHPVAMANGDVQYIDLIAQECKGLDIFGTNVYRGISARDLFQVVKDKLGIPVMFTEFGADAFNAREMREDQVMQARYLVGQWREIYEQSSGKGQVGNAIGGFIFQWSDGWWKFGQESRLDVHDTNASWPNGGYTEDYVQGENNMNEEWWGICAKGPADDRGLYEIYPRAAYYALRQAFRLDPYAPGTDEAAIKGHFDAITPVAAALEARGNHASLLAADFERLRVTGLRLQLETYSTGGTRVSTPPASSPTTGSPAFRGFDHMESFFADFQAKPAPNVSGNLSISVLGNVPRNPIDEIFYENRGRTRTITADGQNYQLKGIERVKVYRADVSWEDRWFQLSGFYRTGHYHWGYEGDFFGLYREANYGQNIDIYNGEAPLGFEISGRRKLDGLKLAFGPQLWWGANPSLLLKYRRRLAMFDATAIYQADLTAQSSATTSSFAVPVPPTRKVTLQAATRRGPFTMEVGGIMAGRNKVGDSFQVSEKTADGYRALLDHVLDNDVYGAKARITMQKGRWNWYAQAARMGLVADGGPTGIVTFTGWSLKDCGSGNQTNLLTGLLLNQGKFQIGPNFLWQKPIVGPMPNPAEFASSSTARKRNILDDPFAVRANRETVGGELLLGYDPTPATWMWAWDNDVREDARFAASLSYVFRHFPTTQDAAIGILADGTTTFPFPEATPARDLWETRVRIVSRLAADTRLVATLFGGTGEPNGNDSRLVKRLGGDARLAWGSVALAGAARFNDWGPYDYHRDFNLTYPVQLMADLSHTLGGPRWFGWPQTRLGVRGVWRSLDSHSPRFCPIELPDATGALQCIPSASSPDGSEWEIRTYLNLSM